MMAILKRTVTQKTWHLMKTEIVVMGANPVIQS